MEGALERTMACRASMSTPISTNSRFSLQSSFLQCFVRNFAWAGRTSRTSELLEHRQPSQSSKGCQNNQAGASSPQDSNWDATGRRNASAPRQSGSPYQISNVTTCRRTWDSGISVRHRALEAAAVLLGPVHDAQKSFARHAMRLVERREAFG